MVELSDWIWLGVIVFWLVLRVVPRLFRSKASREPEREPPSPAATPESRSPGPPDGRQERMGDVGPRPIEPK